MSSVAEQHLIYQITNAPIRDYPYPHFFIENVLPDDYYRQILEKWPDEDNLTCLSDTGRVPKGQYKDRFVMPVTQQEIGRMDHDRQMFWDGFRQWMLGVDVQQAFFEKYLLYINRLRFNLNTMHYSLRPESLLVRDRSNYSIGPHTDAQHRLITVLIYCPRNADKSHLGTSIYIPKDPDFSCAGGPHHPFDRFKQVITMPYRPNSMFCFLKTDMSFHGVEPIQEPGIQRDLILYDLRIENIRQRFLESSSPKRGLLGGLLESVSRNRRD